MIDELDHFRRVIVCCGYVDLRMGISGLSAYVKLNYGLDTLERGTLFLFCGRRPDRIKGLVYVGCGYLMLYVRLSRENRFQWPRTPAQAREVSPEQYHRLLEGFALEGTIKELWHQIPPSGVE